MHSHLQHEGLSGVLPAFSKVLLFLYNKDILEEEAIISWHNEDASEDIKKQVITNLNDNYERTIC